MGVSPRWLEHGSERMGRNFTVVWWETQAPNRDPAVCWGHVGTAGGGWCIKVANSSPPVTDTCSQRGPSGASPAG